MLYSLRTKKMMALIAYTKYRRDNFFESVPYEKKTMRQLSIDGFYLDEGIVKHPLRPSESWEYINDNVINTGTDIVPFITKYSRRVGERYVVTYRGLHILYDPVFDFQKDALNTLPILDNDEFDVLVYVSRQSTSHEDIDITTNGFNKVTEFDHDGDGDMPIHIRGAHVFTNDSGRFRLGDVPLFAGEFFYDGYHSENTVPLSLPGRVLYIGDVIDIDNFDVLECCPFDSRRWG